MGYSQAQKAESRARVLEVASKKIREDGIDSLGVAECMRAAGLTHGAFYAHFESRDALIVAALEQAIDEGASRIEARIRGAQKHGQTPFEAIATIYLSEKHRRHPGAGCALCSLAGEARHTNESIKGLLTALMQRLAERVAQAAGTDDDQGLAIVATFVGAITLARAVDDDALADRILTSSLALVLEQDTLRLKPRTASHPTA